MGPQLSVPIDWLVTDKGLYGPVDRYCGAGPGCRLARFVRERKGYDIGGYLPIGKTAIAS